jgi:hypothetical protein
MKNPKFHKDQVVETANEGALRRTLKRKSKNERRD